MQVERHQVPSAGGTLLSMKKCTQVYAQKNTHHNVLVLHESREVRVRWWRLDVQDEIRKDAKQRQGFLVKDEGKKQEMRQRP